MSEAQPFARRQVSSASPQSEIEMNNTFTEQPRSAGAPIKRGSGAGGSDVGGGGSSSSDASTQSPLSDDAVSTQSVLLSIGGDTSTVGPAHFPHASNTGAAVTTKAAAAATVATGRDYDI